jgi:penicillin-binding protein 1A
MSYQKNNNQIQTIKNIAYYQKKFWKFSMEWVLLVCFLIRFMGTFGSMFFWRSRKLLTLTEIFISDGVVLGILKKNRSQLHCWFTKNLGTNYYRRCSFGRAGW